MSWHLTKHKRGSGQQEIQVAIVVEEMKDHWATDSLSWIESFQKRLADIPKKNSFYAVNGYRATPRNQQALEVWKLKATGEYNYIMFTLTLKN